ncbi:SDR family oxidoreductase [Pseudomonas sp. NPDC090755]|uniref:SDR family oxidoreductase n=1 Tax=Pseudomonas sp. NPDC090755 TaxID=3364481 RepID=UPI00383B93E1
MARYDIRINAIAPGYLTTAMTDGYFDSEQGQAYLRNVVPMRRLGRLQELEGPLPLLASQAGAYRSGSVLAVDGGQWLGSW